MGRNTGRNGSTFMSMSFTRNRTFSSPYFLPNIAMSPMPSSPPRGWLDAKMKRPEPGMFSIPSGISDTLKWLYTPSANSVPVVGYVFSSTSFSSFWCISRSSPQRRKPGIIFPFQPPTRLLIILVRSIVCISPDSQLIPHPRILRSSPRRSCWRSHPLPVPPVRR